MRGQGERDSPYIVSTGFFQDLKINRTVVRGNSPYLTDEGHKTWTGFVVNNDFDAFGLSSGPKIIWCSEICLEP